MSKKVTIEIVFDEVQDEFDEDYTHTEFSSARIVDEETTLSQEQLSSLAEGWSQSDWYSVGFCNSLLDLLDNKDKIMEAKDVKSY